MNVRMTVYHSYVNVLGGSDFDVMLKTMFTLFECIHMFSNSFDNWQISLVNYRYTLIQRKPEKCCILKFMNRTHPQSTMLIGSEHNTPLLTAD